MTTRTPRTRMRRFGAVALAGSLVLAACGGDDDTDPVAQAEPTAQTAVAGDMLGAFGPACDAVPTEGEGSFAGMADDTAATAASNNPLLSTLVSAVVQADLVDTLNSDGPFTVFAPTNDAFAAIPADILDAVLADQDLLTAVLTYHVIGGDSLDAAALGAAGSSATVEGGEITFGADGTTVNDASVICSDVPVANGTVHIVDSVLLPQVALDAIAAMSADDMTDESMADESMDDMEDMDDDAMAEDMDDDAMAEDMTDDDMAGDMLGATGPACGAVPADGEGSFAGMADDTAATAANNNPLLSTLVSAVVQADLVDTLNSDGPFTVFAPTNDAFAAIPAEDLDAVLADVDLLTSILTFHVIAGDQLSAADLMAAGTATTVNGAELTFGTDGEQLTVNGATAICQDVPTANATVHIIDGVLIP